MAAVDGIEASLVFEVQPGEANQYSSANMVRSIEAAIGAMLGAQNTSIAALRVASSQVAATRGVWLNGSRTGALRVDYVVRCASPAQRRQMTAEVERLCADLAPRQRFVQVLAAAAAGSGLSAADASRVRSGMLDRDWSSALAMSRSGGGLVVESQAEAAPEKSWRASHLLRWTSLAVLLVSLVSCAGLGVYIYDVRRAAKKKRGLHLVDGSPRAEDPEVGKAPDGVGFDPKRFDPRRYVSHLEASDHAEPPRTAGRPGSSRQPLLLTGERSGGRPREPEPARAHQAPMVSFMHLPQPLTRHIEHDRNGRGRWPA